MSGPQSYTAGFIAPSGTYSAVHQVQACSAGMHASTSAACSQAPSTEQPKPRSPSEAVVWGGNLPSARRAVVGSLTALGVSQCTA